MSAKIVVSFRYYDPHAHPDAYLDAAQGVVRRALQLGGQLVFWGAFSYAFEFRKSQFRSALKLALVTLHGKPCHAIGMAVSELGRLEMPEGIVLMWGPAFVRANELARRARPGEVVLDPEINEVRRGTVRAVARRKVAIGRSVVEAVVADLERPFQPAPPRTGADLAEASLVGRPELGELLVKAGTLGVLRSSSGVGVTRFFDELEDALGEARILRLAPHPAGEPLGPLRRAITRALLKGPAPPTLSSNLNAALESLLAGEGLDCDSAAELTCAWLRPVQQAGPSGALLIDAAVELDTDTLEVVHRCVLSGQAQCRVIARVGARAPLPPLLADIPLGSEVRLHALLPSEVSALLTQWLGGEPSEELCRLLHERTNGNPLALKEALIEGIEIGYFVWDDDGFIGTVPAEPMNATAIIARRFWRLEPEERGLVKALAVIGGEATHEELRSLLEGGSNPALDFPTLTLKLRQGAWLGSTGALVSLASDTHRVAILAALSPNERRLWHTKVAELLSATRRTMAIANGAVHAALAGDHELSRTLAKTAAEATRAVGLEDTARAFDQMALAGDEQALVERGLLRAGLEERDVNQERVLGSVEPRALEPTFDTLPGLSVLSSTPAPSRSFAVKIPGGKASPGVHGQHSGNGSEVTPRESRPSDAKSADAPRRIPAEVVTALRVGNVERVEAFLIELRSREGHSGLADRLEAMVRLAKGDTGEALRQLRDASVAAREIEGVDRCKALLAYSVALAAAGRKGAALLEALEGLARARETQDLRGEKACSLFLHQLSRSSGHDAAAEVWARVAESVSAESRSR